MVARHGFHSARNESRDNGNSKKKITEATPISPEQSDQNTAWYDSLETDPQVNAGPGNPHGVAFSTTINKVDGWDDDDLHKANYDAGGRWKSGSANYHDMDPKWAVLHHTGCRNGPCSNGYDSSEAYAEHWRDTGKGVHFLVDEKGKIYQIQNIKKSGVHTKKGNTEFGKKHGISNSNSFGIEVDAKNDKHVTPAQQQAVIRLMKLLGMKANNIIGHGENYSDKQKQAGQKILQKIRGGPDFSYGDDYKPNPQGTWMDPTEVTPEM